MTEKQLAQVICAVIFIAAGSFLLVAGIGGRPEAGPSNDPRLDRFLGPIGKRVLVSVVGAMFLAVGIGILLGYW